MRPVRRQSIERPERQDPVVVWRTTLLREAGFSFELADTVARERAYDLHALLELVDRGCPAEVAVRILAPLDADAQPC
jgi:chorismate synthase